MQVINNTKEGRIEKLRQMSNDSREQLPPSGFREQLKEMAFVEQVV